MNQTLRPSILPDNRKMFAIPVVAAVTFSAICWASGVYAAALVPLVIIVVFPGLPIFFHLIFFLAVKFEISPDRLVVVDYAGDKFVKLPRRQEIRFDDIDYVYYLEKEINLLLNLRSALKKYKIPGGETDYTAENLISKYGVEAADIRSFEQRPQKALNDYTAVALFLKLEDIFQRYNVSRKTRRDIITTLKNAPSLQLQYILDMLTDYCLSDEDIDSLKDELANLSTDNIAPFLLTRVNVVKYKKVVNQRYGMVAAARTNIALVLSGKDASQKAYLMHFHDLRDSDLRDLSAIIAERNPSVKFLMTKNERKRLLRKSLNHNYLEP
jgi:hypothetical protein